jgi:GMP synthase-like glutamine amidotransferase
MTKPILILRNIPRENPGLIEILIREHQLKYQIIDFNNATIIESIENYGALIVLGGPESANDLTSKMQNELTLIKKAMRLQIPYLGVCLGLQILIKAMGGNVVKCQISEIGFRDTRNEFFKVKLTAEGRTDKLFNNLPENLTVFQLHGETVQLTPIMTLLAVGEFCQNQIIKIGENAYGIQSHFELTNDLLESWITEDSDLLKIDADQLRSDFELIKKDYQETGRRLFENFLMLTGFITKRNFQS